MLRPKLSIPDSPDVLSIVRDYLSRHRECEAQDAHELALVLRLSETEIEFALEALRVEGEVLA